MKNKKIQCIALSMGLVVSLLVFGGCNSLTGTNTDVDNKKETEPTTVTEPYTQVETEPTTVTETTQETTQEETLPEINEEYDKEIPDVTGEWNALDGEAVSSGMYQTLFDIYGTGAKYGGLLELNNDSTMTINVGISSGKDNKGTYTIDNNGIHVTYSSGNEDTFYYYDDYNGQEAIKAQIGDYFIYFVRN